MTKILVYGTLRKGYALNGYLQSGTFLGDVVLEGFQMYTNGSFPMIVEGDGKIRGELYQFDSVEGLKVLDRIESAYTRSSVTTNLNGEKVDCETYIYDHSIYGLEKIEVGDWREYSNKNGEFVW